MNIPYQFVDFITEEEYTAFVQKHKKSHILQSSEWGTFKASLGNWKTYRVGIRQGDELCAATMILIRQLPFPFSHKSFAYAPRGFVTDF
ncbi:peptidoglycan bridge formation glycyltransferase FemA/FemB family protein [Shimazuella kribbensis]|uniref:peptidoglycan bridge formation glycyltransferase FemA/FemB family protein n=1 Tax=Shimazuella kribbensis TaxID=139808 RepID=UPI00041D116F|nr:peptidoglycan bridge formation glycyltransferase FemA/FemB family protein [Shimazuella kribbensis]